MLFVSCYSIMQMFASLLEEYYVGLRVAKMQNSTLVFQDYYAMVYWFHCLQ